MPLSKTVGNMYPWVTHKKTYTRGKCKHGCTYCYVPHSRAARFYSGKPRFVKKELEEDLGSGKIIFVGHMTDMFGSWMPAEWIESILEHCRKYPGNKYLFQSKNPARFLEFLNHFPIHTIFGTTIETTSSILLDPYSKAPHVSCRMMAMSGLSKEYDKMISIEPIMDFRVDTMINWVHQINPKFVSIGADSKGHKLPEPSAADIHRLMTGLGAIEVKLKSNLKRLGVW